MEKRLDQLQQLERLFAAALGIDGAIRVLREAVRHEDGHTGVPDPLYQRLIDQLQATAADVNGQIVAIKALFDVPSAVQRFDL